MKPGDLLPTAALDPASGEPLQRQIYRRIREAIAGGRLAPGERLPSSRGLAAQIGVARGTIDAAYGLLAGEGYIQARGPAGTIVSPALDPPRLKAMRPVSTRGGARSHPPSPDLGPGAGTPPPFRVGLPAFDAFPRTTWARLVARRARALDRAAMAYPDPAGLAILRQALTSYLAVARGIACNPAQIFITAGYQSALGLIGAARLRAGDEVWFEDPGYYEARRALAAAGARLVAVPVDDEGMRIEEGIRKAPAARFAVVTPSHQLPLGMALGLPRRLRLLAWAEARGAFVIEDDYDSEFHYAGPPLPALKSLDRGERVIYAGTFSKVLFPGVRLGYLVVPEAEIAAFAAAAGLRWGGPSPLMQAVVADFILEGHFGRHVKRMRGLYALRRQALATALEEAFAGRLKLALAAGGMHLLAYFPECVEDRTLASRARGQGLAPTELSALCLERTMKPALLLGFTNIPEGEAMALALRLRRALGPVGKAPGRSLRPA